MALKDPPGAGLFSGRQFIEEESNAQPEHYQKEISTTRTNIRGLAATDGRLFAANLRCLNA
ncbi:MAG TPA: hypothetical protein VH985_11360 [Candidatus Binatia bacterium]